MSTYEELSLIVSVALLIVAILNLTNKKQPSCPEKADDYFLVSVFAGTGEMQSPSGCLVKYIIAKYTKMSIILNYPMFAYPMFNKNYMIKEKEWKILKDD